MFKNFINKCLQIFNSCLQIFYTYLHVLTLIYHFWIQNYVFLIHVTYFLYMLHILTHYNILITHIYVLVSVGCTLTPQSQLQSYSDQNLYFHWVDRRVGAKLRFSWVFLHQGHYKPLGSSFWILKPCHHFGWVFLHQGDYNYSLWGAAIGTKAMPPF